MDTPGDRTLGEVRAWIIQIIQIIQIIGGVLWN
jgi:hypothetical protein